MKTIIEEHLHNFRAQSAGVGGSAGLSGSIIRQEEAWVDEMVESVFAIGRDAGGGRDEHASIGY